MTNKPGIDLSELDTTKHSDVPFELEIVHPVSKLGTGAFISVYGANSTVSKEFQAENTNRKLREAAVRAQTGKEAPIPTVEDRRREGTELLVACTAGFRNITFEGKALEFSHANAFKLYEKLDFVRLQVDAAIADISNFMKV